MDGSGDQPYKKVHSLVRAFQLIDTLGELGWAKIGQLSAASGVERASTYRLVNTLEQLGYITRRSVDGSVALSSKFAHLADALKGNDIVTQLAWPYLYALSKDILWPCDLAMFESGKVLIRLSTHKISPMSIHRGMVGKERYFTRSALGMAILSALPDEKLELSLQIIEQLGGANAQDVRDRSAIRRIIEGVRNRGYASSVGLTENKISAIALPVIAADGMVAGAVNIIFFRSALTTEQAADRYLDKLRNCVQQIELAYKVFAERNDPA